MCLDKRGTTDAPKNGMPEAKTPRPIKNKYSGNIQSIGITKANVK